MNDQEVLATGTIRQASEPRRSRRLRRTSPQIQLETIAPHRKRKRLQVPPSDEQRPTDVIAEDPDRPLGKILLLQERVRHDPWKLLVATSLLNVTSGRAARPIFWDLLDRYPDAVALANASIKELESLLYPLGLSNRRAVSLKRCSQQYIDFKWPCPDDATLDVNIFFGAGLYASDSFRIYSDLLPGGGAPQCELEWIAYQQTKIKNPAAERPARSPGQDANDAWRTVRPKDKELRRYLVWRWGIEGIAYDALRGPSIIDPWDGDRLRETVNPGRAARSTASEKAPVPARPGP